jgi:hypothetical protein
MYVYIQLDSIFYSKPEGSENAQNQNCKLKNLENWAQAYA